MYRKTFVVKVTLTPGNGYEDCSMPHPKVMRDAIRRAIAKDLSRAGYIAGRVISVKPMPRRTKVNA